MTSQNFCTKCGAQLQDGQKFCTSCGSASGNGPELPTASPAGRMRAEPSARQAPSEGTHQQIASDRAAASVVSPRRGKRGAAAIAALSVIAVAAIALVVLLATGVIDIGDVSTPRDSAETQEKAADVQEESPDVDSSAQKGGSDSLTDAEDDGAAATESQSGGKESETDASVPPVDTPSLSLENENDYYRINLCLSNFSEINSVMNGYRSSRADPEKIFQFSYAHAALNSNSAVQLGEYWPSSGNGPYYSRISFDFLEKYAELFLKETLTPSDIPFDVCYENGYVYVNPDQRGLEDEFGNLSTFYPEGIALATKLEYLGNDQYQIEFEIYSNAYGEAYTVTDESYYHMTPQELANAFGQRFPSYVGTAVLEDGYNDEAAPFKLLSYDSTPV